MTNEKNIRVRAHSDADGITSAYFLSWAVKNPKIEIWTGDFGDTTGLKKGDYMVDMKPIQNMEGLNVIDHHFPHPEDRKYNLYPDLKNDCIRYASDIIPATYLVWDKYKEEIPKSQWWKIAIGLMGDGQPQLIPTEVFDLCPELSENIKTSIVTNYGKISVNSWPMYKLLSSPINALLRMSEDTKALNLLAMSTTPRHIFNNVDARKAKNEVKSEFNRILGLYNQDKLNINCEIFDFSKLMIVTYQSDIRMAGYIATQLNSQTGKTILCIDKKTGKGSLRGDLAVYWGDKLKHFEYLTVGGHPGYMGLSVTKDVNSFIDDILEMKV